MALTKRNYINNQTVITAENLNAIQDELIRVGNGLDNGSFQGEPGEDGVGIATIQQTTTSTADGGSNIVTVTLTNGSKQTFTVKNGSKGSTGAPGSPGANGSDGADGVTPNFSIGTVTTLSAGSNATATITGTKENPVLNLGIPKGADGSGGSGGSGTDGEDGGYYVPSVDSSGNLRWTASKTGMPSVQAVNIKGADGADGKDGRTPARGTDYWTAADIAQIKSYVDDAILGGAW